MIRHWHQSSERSASDTGFVAFGYDMDNMKARAWAEGEMPLWLLDGETREWLDDFIRRATAGAGTVTRLVIRAAKSALYDRPRDAGGDFGFMAERFYRDTEEAFYSTLGEAVALIKGYPDSDDPAIEARRHWASIIETAALPLFDEYAPSEGLEVRDMHRHVKARFYLTIALRGHGKAGKSLFDDDLGIPSPETTRSRSREREAA